MHPRALVEGFVVEETEAGLVLRHPQREAVVLSGVAAAVWRGADGLRSVDDLARQVAAPVDAVWQALDELADAELVVVRVAPPAASRGFSRREVLSLAAAGAVTAGLAPGSAAAAGAVETAAKEQRVKPQRGSEDVAREEQEKKRDTQAEGVAREEALVDAARERAR